MSSALDDIRSGFKSQIPIAALEVIAPEEIPTIARICSVFSEKDVYYWSLGTNSIKLFSIKNGELIEAMADYNGTGEPFTAILHHIRNTQTDGLYILADMQKFIGCADGLEDVVSLVKALFTELKQTNKNILFMGVSIRLHENLSRLISTYSQPLPIEQEIAEHVEEYIAELIRSQDHINSTVNLEPKDYTAIAQAALAMSLEEVSDFLRRYAVTQVADNHLIFDRKIIEEIAKYKARILSQQGIELAQPATCQFGGMDNLRNWLVQRKLLFTAEARNFGLPKPKGVFLAGPPGTGKSLIAKNVASILNFPLLKLDLAGLLGSLVGESEGNVKRALRVASSISPCVLWIDEVDKALQGQSDSSGVSQRILGQILEWMQEQTGVFVVATANNVEALPPEFLRKGRFDENFFVDLPTIEERLEILKIHLANYKVEIAQEHLEVIASNTTNFSGAELAAIVQESAIKAFEESGGKSCTIKLNHLENASHNCIPLARSNSDQITKMREWSSNIKPASSPFSKEETKRVGTTRIKKNS